MRGLIVGVAIALCAACESGADSLPRLDCRVGAYALDDGRVLDLGPTAAGERLRWRLMDGRTGGVAAEDGVQRSTLGWSVQQSEISLELFPCEAGRVRFDGHEGVRAPLQPIETTFESEGVTLAGRLVMPAGDAAAPVIVMIGGSETESALFYNSRQRLYPAQGVGVFVYDKRGTGASQGAFTEDLRQLARDAAAASQEARRLAGARLARLGYLGGSEGGSVAPLAQELAPADFVIVEYGLAISPMHIDRDLIVDDLRRAGYGPDIQAKGAELGEAIAVLVSSNYSRGWDEFFALRNRYRREDWIEHVEGDYADAFIKTPPLLARAVFPTMDRFTDNGADWDYDPVPVIRAISAPQLWLVAGNDTVSPEATTRERLVALQQAGVNITLVDFPTADHGMLEYDGPNDGEHLPLRYSAGYLDAALNFALGSPTAEAPSPP